MSHALIDDVAFDERLPIGLQIKAAIHFTPVEVARRATQWLVPEGSGAVLDVGAGAGKFCLVAAHAAPSARFVGVELRPQLVRLAARIAHELRLSNAEFIHGNAFDLDWSSFDAFYLYNPFAEQVFAHALVLDRSIELDPRNFDAYVTAVLDRLARAPVGTRVVTYHGFGADPPAGYELATSDLELELWIKRTTAGTRRLRKVELE